MAGTEAPTLVELRVLDGANLYFPRPAIKLTLEVPGLLSLPEERVAAVAGEVGLMAGSPGPPGGGSQPVQKPGASASLGPRVHLEMPLIIGLMVAASSLAIAAKRVRIPYNVALVDLEEGPRVTSRVVVQDGQTIGLAGLIRDGSSRGTACCRGAGRS